MKCDVLMIFLPKLKSGLERENTSDKIQKRYETLHQQGVSNCKAYKMIANNKKNM